MRLWSCVIFQRDDMATIATIQLKPTGTWTAMTNQMPQNKTFPTRWSFRESSASQQLKLKNAKISLLLRGIQNSRGTSLRPHMVDNLSPEQYHLLGNPSYPSKNQMLGQVSCQGPEAAAFARFRSRCQPSSRKFRSQVRCRKNRLRLIEWASRKAG